MPRSKLNLLKRKWEVILKRENLSMSRAARDTNPGYEEYIECDRFSRDSINLGITAQNLQSLGNFLCQVDCLPKNRLKTLQNLFKFNNLDLKIAKLVAENVDYRDIRRLINYRRSLGYITNTKTKFLHLAETFRDSTNIIDTEPPSPHDINPETYLMYIQEKQIKTIEAAHQRMRLVSDASEASKADLSVDAPAQQILFSKNGRRVTILEKYLEDLEA